jgi:replicative DNA helicase
MVSERVGPEHFFEPLHGRIFSAIVKLHAKGRNPNPVLLRPIFENDPDIQQVGGPAYLAQLTGSAAAIIGIIDFADQIAELAIRRAAGAAMLTAVDRLCDTTEDSGVEEIDDIISNVQDTVYVAMARSQPMAPRSAKAMVKNIRRRSEALTESQAPVGFSCRSVPDMDAVMGKLEPGYHVIAGRPGMCKTTLAMTAAWGWAAAGAPGEYYASEMTGDQVDMRHVSDLSHAMRRAVRHDRLREGKLTERELADLLAVEEMAETLPLNFVAAGKTDIRRVEAAATRAALRWKNRGRRLEFIVLDYMQKFLATDERGRLIRDETEKVNAISATIERISQRLEIAVIALSQVSRSVEERKDKRPLASDLRQSGNIEQDADTVTFVYRDEVYLVREKPKKPDESKEFQAWQLDMNIARGQLEIISAKNRHGKQRTRTVKFLPHHYAIRGSDYSDSDPDPILGPDLFADEIFSEPGL